MSQLSEPDDVDFFVVGVESDARTHVETIRFIEDFKNRPDPRLEPEDAERILGVGCDRFEGDPEIAP